MLDDDTVLPRKPAQDHLRGSMPAMLYIGERNQLRRASGDTEAPFQNRKTTPKARLFGRINGAFATTSAKFAEVYHRHIERQEIPNDVVKSGLRLPTSDVAKALF